MPTFSGSPHPTIGTGRRATIAIKPDGTLEGWGTEATVPPPALTDVVTLSVNYGYCLAVHGDGSVTAFGTPAFDYGQGTVPGGLGAAAQVDTSRDHVALLLADGTVECWGRNTDGECDVPVGLSNVTKVVAGLGFTVALKDDGTLVEWGNPPSPAPAVSGVTDIACYSKIVAIVFSDGTAQAWGASNNNDNTPPAGLDDAVQIAAGNSHTMARKADGTIAEFDAAFGTAMPAGLTGVVHVCCGWQVFSALHSDGSVTMWGYEEYGEMTPPAAFEAMLPGSAPPQDFIDASVTFSAQMNGTLGEVATLSAGVSFAATARAYQDWTKAVDPRQVQKIYLFTLTGAANGLPDLTLPVPNWQATNQAGERKSYLQGVIPVNADLLQEISDRTDGELVIAKGFRFSDGSVQTEELLRSNFDTFRYDRGPGSFTVTASGYLPPRPLANDARTLTGVRSINLTNGKRRVRCDVDFFLQPGMTVTALDEVFSADYINYFVNESDEFCEVSER